MPNTNPLSRPTPTPAERARVATLYTAAVRARSEHEARRLKAARLYSALTVVAPDISPETLERLSENETFWVHLCVFAGQRPASEKTRALVAELVAKRWEQALEVERSGHCRGCCEPRRYSDAKCSCGCEPIAEVE